MYLLFFPSEASSGEVLLRSLVKRLSALDRADLAVEIVGDLYAANAWIEHRLQRMISEKIRDAPEIASMHRRADAEKEITPDRVAVFADNRTVKVRVLASGSTPWNGPGRGSSAIMKRLYRRCSSCLGVGIEVGRPCDRCGGLGFNIPDPDRSVVDPRICSHCGAACGRGREGLRDGCRARARTHLTTSGSVAACGAETAFEDRPSLPAVASRSAFRSLPKEIRCAGCSDADSKENLKPARLVHPGAILKRELDARGWTQGDLATIMKRPPQAISEIIQGTKQITPETAIALAAALGTSSEFWVNLESRYRLLLEETGR